MSSRGIKERWLGCDALTYELQSRTQVLRGARGDTRPRRLNNLLPHPRLVTDTTQELGSFDRLKLQLLLRELPEHIRSNANSDLGLLVIMRREPAATLVEFAQNRRALRLGALRPVPDLSARTDALRLASKRGGLAGHTGIRKHAAKDGGPALTENSMASRTSESSQSSTAGHARAAHKSNHGALASSSGRETAS